MAGEWQASIIQPSFRGVPFYCNDTSNTFGRRIAYHEFPQYDIPYAEDMGRKGRKFDINCFVIGDDWESKRDALIAACEAEGAGILVHPDIGTQTVACESCVVTESKTQNALMAVFQITFLETGEQGSASISVNTTAAVINQGTLSIGNMGNDFAGSLLFANPIQDIQDAVLGTLAVLTNIASIPLSLLSTASIVKDVLNTSIHEPHAMCASISKYTSAFNNDYSITGTELRVQDTGLVSANYSQVPDTILIPANVTNPGKYQQPPANYTLIAIDANPNNHTHVVDATSALNIYLDICNQPVMHTKPDTQFAVVQNNATRSVELVVKAFAIVEASVAVSNITFKSLEDAQTMWTGVLNAYDKVLDLASDLNKNHIFHELKTVRAAVVADIKTRAPSLAHLIYRSFEEVTPALVIAYSMYEDVAREDEIIKRNNIIHPGFILTHKLELLHE